MSLNFTYQYLSTRGITECLAFVDLEFQLVCQSAYADDKSGST